MRGPILIAGDGRSGTTLLSVILDANPGLAVGPELHLRGPKDLGHYILEAIEIWRCSSSEQWDELRYHSELRNAFHFVQRAARFGVEPLTLRDIINARVDAGSKLESFEERCLLVEDIAKHKAFNQNASMWGFKIMRDLPLYEKYMNCWPNALFIHIVRDGRDVAASQMIDHAGWGYDNIRLAAEGWCKMISVAEELPEDQVLEIRYEDLIIDTENVTKTLCDFVGVAWAKDMLNHTEHQSVFLANHYKHPSGEQVRKPLFTNSIGRYKKELSPDHICEFEDIASSCLIKYGYLAHARKS